MALFAPCCITFLFPSYLGTIFTQTKRVSFYTLVFSLGLATILIPIAFGIRFFIFFFNAFHQPVYYLGGLVLIFMGIITLKPLIRFPSLFHVKPQVGKNVNIFSVYGLGLLSGLTSSCCAPVLFAAVTLTTLAPTFLQALVVASAYVLGIVFPLFILSLGYKKLTVLFSGKKRERIYGIFKNLGAAIFIMSGIAILILAFFNKIQMNQFEGYSNSIRYFVFGMGRYFRNPLTDILSFFLIIFIFYKLLKNSQK